MTDTKTLYVDLEVLKSKVIMLTRLERALDNVESTLKTLAGDTGNFWEGRAHTVFVKNQRSLRKDIRKLRTQVELNRDNLTQAVAQYEKTEKEIDSLVDSLSTDDIF